MFSDACSVGNEQLILHLGVRPRLGIVQESVKMFDKMKERGLLSRTRDKA